MKGPTNARLVTFQNNLLSITTVSPEATSVPSAANVIFTKTVVPRSASVPLIDIGKVFSTSPSAGMVITGVAGPGETLPVSKT